MYGYNVGTIGLEFMCWRCGAGVHVPQLLCWSCVARVIMLEFACWSLRAGCFVLVLLRCSFCCVCAAVHVLEFMFRDDPRIVVWSLRWNEAAPS